LKFEVCCACGKPSAAEGGSLGASVIILAATPACSWYYPENIKDKECRNKQ
jgi:hypothetical protein